MAEFLKDSLGLSEHAFYGNSIADWGAAGLLSSAVWVGLSLVRRFLASRGRRYSVAGRPTAVRLIFHLFGDTKQFLVLALALYAGLADLSFPPRPQHII